MCFVETTLALALLAVSTASAPLAADVVSGKPEPWVVGLVAADSASAAALEAGARQATDAINAAGGIEGSELNLVTLEVGGAWSDAADRTARLVFEHRVVGLVGPSDDTMAHVAAQIATRRRIPLIVLSPEESLTRAHVPWIFRGVPDDGLQARALLDWSLEGRAGATAVIAVPEGRSGREREATLRRVCNDAGIRVLRTMTPASRVEPGVESADVLLLWLDAGPAVELVRALGPRGIPSRILGSTRLDRPQFMEALPDWAAVALPMLRAGSPATPVRGLDEAMGFDGVRLLAQAAADRGTETVDLRAALAAGHLQGRSGDFGFDRNGNRIGLVDVGILRDGKLRRAASATPNHHVPAR